MYKITDENLKNDRVYIELLKSIFKAEDENNKYEKNILYKEEINIDEVTFVVVTIKKIIPSKISYDKSLLGRKLMIPDELMRFKFKDAIFMRARMHPIKIKMSKIPNRKKEFKLSCFNLDEFRKEKTLKSMNSKVELE